MSNHVTEWLSAYLDGELYGNRLHYVKAHLDECEICQTELESLQKLSGWLREVPAPQFISPVRLAAQVSLRLHHPKPVAPGKKVLEFGWWMVPVGLLATWGFLSLSFFINDLVSVANRFGLLTSVSNWWIFSTLNTADWSPLLGQFGILRGNILDFAVSTETFTRISLLEISLQISVALLYLSWIAIWWAHHTRREHGQPLEG